MGSALGLIWRRHAVKSCEVSAEHWPLAHESLAVGRCMRGLARVTGCRPLHLGRSRHESLRTIYYYTTTAIYSLPTTHDLPPTTYYLLPTTYYLQSTYYLLPITTGVSLPTPSSPARELSSRGRGPHWMPVVFTVLLKLLLGHGHCRWTLSTLCCRRRWNPFLCAVRVIRPMRRFRTSTA